MTAPKYRIEANRIDFGTAEESHQRNPSWCVAFVRYEEPASGYNSEASRLRTKPVLVVENDCMSVQISNPKGSFGKTCSMTMRAGEVYYPGALSPGDWVFVWMSDYQEDIDLIIDSLNTLRNTKKRGETSLCDWKSGLKFAGRVLSVGANDAVAANGTRIVSQTIQAQSFMEFATSVYYTEIAQAIFTRSVTGANTQVRLGAFQQNGLDKALGNLGNKFIQFFTQTNLDPRYLPSPDVAIAFYYTIAMGVDADGPFLKGLNMNVAGLLSDAIDIPSDVAQIFDKKNAKKLWQLINVYLGIQKYSTKGDVPWVNFNPEAEVFSVGGEPVFFKTPDRLKGWVDFYPSPWDNKALWSIFNEYLNEPMNELYTALRIDQFGRIRPSLIAREKPFGTKLFETLQNKKMIEVIPDKGGESQKKPAAANEPNTKSKKFLPSSLAFLRRADEEVRGMYDTHPRWVIDENMIHAVNVACSEANRINFVQLWGRSSITNVMNPSTTNSQANSIEVARTNQMIIGNMVSDDADISRHGLRANVAETPFDFPDPTQSRAPYWSRIRADWLLNGHLKAQGSVSINGVREPICEGDNAQVRGIVYHIEGVTHQGQITNSGKSFTTSLSLSNGILASSLDNQQIPSYLIHQGSDADTNRYMPGTTDIQRTTKLNRDPTGERFKREDDE